SRHHYQRATPGVPFDADADILAPMSTPLDPTQLRMDPNTLYREDVYTDRRIGTIRVLTPVTSMGATDSSRPVLYVGETQLLTPGGLLPLAFEIDARSLSEPIEGFATRPPPPHA